LADPSADLREPHRIGEQAARALRLELDLAYAPIGGPHLWELIRERGVDLAFHNFGSQGGDGLYLWDGSRGLIALNTSNRKPLRVRFTASHELGHHEMHRYTLENVLLSDKDVMKGSSDSIESEANAFAAEFLMPEEALRREFAARDPETLEPLDVVRVMRTYGLSYEATLYRLQNSRVITSRRRQELEEAGRGRVIQLEAALGFDERAQFGAPSTLLPEEFVLNAIRLFQSGGIDDDRLTEFLRTKKSDALKLVGEVQPLAENGPALAEIDALLDA
jgi:Zn-dependent peptidase ImmA (M78 family)